MWFYEIVWIDGSYDAGEAPTPSRCHLMAMKRLYQNAVYAVSVRPASPVWY